MCMSYRDSTQGKHSPAENIGLDFPHKAFPANSTVDSWLNGDYILLGQVSVSSEGRSAGVPSPLFRTPASATIASCSFCDVCHAHSNISMLSFHSWISFIVSPSFTQLEYALKRPLTPSFRIARICLRKENSLSKISAGGVETFLSDNFKNLSACPTKQTAN